MEIRKRIDFRKVFAIAYIVVSLTFITIGLQPAEATSRDIQSSAINIPSIGLVSSVTKLALKNHRLDTPNTIVGSYKKKNSNKTFLVAHSTTAFKNLKFIHDNDTIAYDGKLYRVNNIVSMKKEDIDMDELLRADKNGRPTIILMTCAGELYDNGDASHRLIVTATLQG